MAIALYARKSTESDDRQAQSLDDQIRALTDLASREGISIAETFVESKSAKAPGERPEFARLVELIEAGRIDAVLTWSVSRLARNPVDGGRIAYLLQTGRLRYIRTVEKTYLPEDNALLMSIETGMATSFVQNLRRDTLRGMRSKADAGWMTARAPIGYLNNPHTHEIDVDPQRFAIVRKGWQMILEGGNTIQDVRREMARLGLTSRHRGGTRALSDSSVYRIFSNPFYCGRFTFQGEVKRGRHAPMVSEADFEEAQGFLRGSSAPRSKRHEFAYRGLLRCAACGCSVTAERKVKRYKGTGQTAEYVYYHCSNSKGGCRKTSVREEELRAVFDEAFDAIVVPPAFAEWASEALVRHASQENDRLGVTEREVRRRIEADRVRLRRLGDLWLDGEVGRDEYEPLRSELKDRIKAAEDDLESERRLEERVDAYLQRRFAAIGRAGTLTEGDPEQLRARALTLGGPHLLNLGTPEIRLDPLAQKIAAFEPLRNGSEKPKVGDVLSQDSVWGAFLRDVRTSTRLELGEAEDRRRTPPS